MSGVNRILVGEISTKSKGKAYVAEQAKKLSVESIAEEKGNEKEEVSNIGK